MKKFSYTSFAQILFTALIICLPLFAVAAQGGSTDGTTYTSPGGSTYTSPGGKFSVENPLKGSITSFCGLLEALLRAAIVLGLPVAVLFLIYTGFKFIIARGNEKELGDAKRSLLYTIVGIGIFLGAWTIAQIIKNTLKSLGVGSFGAC